MTLPVHLNGSINLEDTDTVLAELATRLGPRLHAYPDGETDPGFEAEDIKPGNRRYWIWFQVPVLQHALGEPEWTFTFDPETSFPVFSAPEDFTENEDPFPNLGYADAYLDSYRRFLDQKDEGLIAADAKFQAQFPTPKAVMTFVRPEDVEQVLPAYSRAMAAEIVRFIAEAYLLRNSAGQDLVIQLDVCTEIGELEGWFGPKAEDAYDVALPVIELINAIPEQAEVAVHLCYGDYRHRHLSEPADIGNQTLLALELDVWADRPIEHIAFTVPADRRDRAFFEPLADVNFFNGTAYFGIVPYHPEAQEAGITEDQITWIKELYDGAWGVTFECGLGRVDSPEKVRELLDLAARIADSD